MESEAEELRIEAASKMAGEYLESLGKTDLAIMTENEWRNLLRVVIKAYHESPPF